MVEINKGENSLSITLKAIKLGDDWNISIMGGDSPHIGAVAMAVPRVSLSDTEKLSSSVSLLTVVGHKEDEIVMPVARRVAEKTNAIVVVACGIHIDNISFNEINILITMVNEAVDEFINGIE